jgi:hypothetical protein
VLRVPFTADKSSYNSVTACNHCVWCGSSPSHTRLPCCAAVCALLQQQVLVRAAPELRLAGRQLSGTGRMPVLLWVVNQVGWLAGWLKSC